MTEPSYAADLTSAFEEKERLENSGSLRWFHWAIILASLVLTLGAWSFTKAQHEAQVRERFDRESEQVVELVAERMRQYETVLSSGAAAIESKFVFTDSQAWRKYALTLNFQTKYPGINGIGFIDHLDRADLEAYVAAQRVRRPDFRIHPVHSGDQLFPIIFIEPVEINAAAVGLDMAHESNRFTAAKKARDTGTPQITGPITLVQDSRKTPGFLFFSPVYAKDGLESAQARQENLIGLVYAPFIVDKLMRGTLENDKRRVGLRISDEGSVLFNENQKGYVGFDPRPMFKTTETINVYGRNWTFDVWTKRSFDRTAANNKPRMILIGGLAIDALLLTLFTLLAQANRRAITFAGRMAAAQQADAARLKNIIDNTVEGMMTSAPATGIRSFNKACEKIFGYKAAEVIGQDIQMLFPKADTGYDYSADADGRLEGNEVTGYRKDGSHIPLEVSLSTIDVEGDTIYSLIIRDVTLRKEADAKLKQTLNDLMISNEDLEKFAYIASHDLKSPLRGIDNLSKWLAEDLDSVLDDENRGRIETLRGRVDRMDNLLDDLLDYSRAGYSVETSKSVQASDLVSEVWDMLDVPPDFKLSVGKSLDEITTARMPLEQILHNLINNALKHHDKADGTVTVSCRTQGDFYEYTVADDGPGIAPEFHEKVFEMFQTLRPRDEVEGSGMGLALVRKLVYCYGGRVSVDSTVGEGSRFIFTLPQVMRERIKPTREDYLK